MLSDHVSIASIDPRVQSETRRQGKAQAEKKVKSRARATRTELDGAEKSIDKKVDFERERDPNQNVIEQNRLMIVTEKLVQIRATRGETNLGEDQQNEHTEETEQMNDPEQTAEIDI